MTLKSCPFCKEFLSESVTSPRGYTHPHNGCFFETCLISEDDFDAWNNRTSPWVDVSKPPKQEGKYLTILSNGEYWVAFYGVDDIFQPNNPAHWHVRVRKVTCWQPIEAPE